MNHKIHTFDLMIEPTNKCQLRCPTCFSHQDGRKKTSLKFHDFKQIIDKNSHLIRRISLYNYGEPLINPEIWMMVAYAKSKNIPYVKISTNGLLINKYSNEILKSGLDYLSISLDGATQKIYAKFRRKGRLDSIIKGISKLVNMRNSILSRLRIEIQFIIMKHNEHQLLNIERLARRLKVDFLRLKTVLIKNNKWSYLLPKDEIYSRYSGLKKTEICKKPLKELVINCDGTIIPCCYITGPAIASFNFGSIFDQTLQDVLNSKKYRDFVLNCSTNKSNNPCCRNCFEGQAFLDHKVIKL